MTETQNRDGQRQISGERRFTYYVGLGLIVIGFLVFFSVFISAAASMNNPMAMGFGGGPNPGSLAVRAFIGFGMIVAGSILRSLGARGAAGSGLVLDPQQSRRDLEPWTRMAGGMIKDAVDESGIRAGSSQESAKLAFDEKLRRLEKLHQDGLVTDAEYQKKRAEILEKDW